MRKSSVLCGGSACSVILGYRDCEEAKAEVQEQRRARQVEEGEGVERGL